MPLVAPIRKKAHARVALLGPAGSGKSWTALEIAQGLADGKTIAVIDTERESMNKYYGEIGNTGAPHLFSSYSPPLESYSPDNFTRAIEEIAKIDGVGVLIIDSLSHAWGGKGGALERVTDIQKRSQSSNSFAAWRDVTPLHNRMIDTIISAPFHVIVTLRTKIDYIVEKDERTGRTTIRKVGLAPIQKEGLEYEFDIVGDINQEHELIVSKTRMKSLKDEVIKEPGADFGRRILDWCTNTPSEIPTISAPIIEQVGRTKEELTELINLAKSAGFKSPKEVMDLSAREFNKHPKDLADNEFSRLQELIKSSIG